jgi:hypothetical protein
VKQPSPSVSIVLAEDTARDVLELLVGLIDQTPTSTKRAALLACLVQLQRQLA